MDNSFQGKQNNARKAVTPPKYVKQVLIDLQAHGYKAYLVGGCCRDMLLGVTPNDWDICTSALPAEICSVFDSTVLTGAKHGTVTVIIGSHRVEVTTFRLENTYSDHRHPDNVMFVADLTEDLKRRDFTMNAIAIPPDGYVSDPFGGRDDIRNRLIRCVGNPEERFEEDALRMFRALRFSARLGFDIEEKTYSAIEKKAALASELAPERIHDELEKILLTNRPEIIADAVSLGLLDRFIECRNVCREKLKLLPTIPRKQLMRWSALCSVLMSSGCITDTKKFLGSLRSDRRTLSICNTAQRILEGPIPGNPVEWKKLLSRYGRDAVSCASCGFDIVSGSESRAELRKVLKSGEPYSMADLALNGDDLLAMGYRGKELGNMLGFLLDYIISFPEYNKKDILISLVQGISDD